MLNFLRDRLRPRHLIAVLFGVAVLVTGGLVVSSHQQGEAEAQNAPTPGEIYAFFRNAPTRAEAPSFRENNASGAVIRPAIDQPGHQVFGVAAPDGELCLVVQHGWASRGCMPTKELADGTKLMWSLDYTGGDQVQLTALIPDAVSGVGMQWRSGNRLPATVNNNVLQVGGTRANLPITVSWTDPAGTAHEQSISG